MFYNWSYFDKRNRLCHNMIMEHFEVHKEQLEDLLIELDREGPRVFVDIPEVKEKPKVTMDDLALIDELSGLNLYLDNFLMTNNAPETLKARIRSRMVRYSGERPKELAMNELRMKLFGDQR